MVLRMNPPSNPLSAVLLAAGRSTRMGRDKALLEIGGRPLWQRQREVLAELGATEIFLSARPEQPWAQGAAGFDAVLHDALPHSGPLAGITAALERATHPHVAVLAIDLPRLSAGWFAGLWTRCAPGVGVVGRQGDFFEPLAAIYPREIKWLAWEALAGGELSLQKLLTAALAQGLMRAQEIAPAEARQFENWNDAAAVRA